MAEMATQALWAPCLPHLRITERAAIPSDTPLLDLEVGGTAADLTFREFSRSPRAARALVLQLRWLSHRTLMVTSMRMRRTLSRQKRDMGMIMITITIMEKRDIRMEMMERMDTGIRTAVMDTRMGR